MPYPSRVIAEHHARIVREKAIHRGLITLSREIAERAYEAPPQWTPDYADESIAVAEYGIAKIAARTVHKPEPGKAETLSTILWKLEHQGRRLDP